MKERKKEIHSFWRYIGILLFDFFTLHFKKDTLLKGSFNMFYNVISTIFHNIHDKLLLCTRNPNFSICDKNLSICKKNKYEFKNSFRLLFLQTLYTETILLSV